MIKILSTDTLITDASQLTAETCTCSRCKKPTHPSELTAQVILQTDNAYVYCRECFADGPNYQQAGIAVDNHKERYFLKELHKAGLIETTVHQFTEKTKLITVIYHIKKTTKLARTIEMCEFHFKRGN